MNLAGIILIITRILHVCSLYRLENGYRWQQNKERTYAFISIHKKTKYLELKPETCPGEAYCQLWETNMYLENFKIIC